mgnify:FL=1|jgi:F-type H+-transporting ATPase subunit delta
MPSRRAVAAYVAAQLASGATSTDVMQQLAAYLVDHRLTKHAARYVADIELELTRLGEVVADVTTARPLTDELRDAVAQMVAAGADTTASRVALREHLDTSLIGGVVVRTAGKEYDRSIKSALRGLRSA